MNDKEIVNELILNWTQDNSVLPINKEHNIEKLNTPFKTTYDIIRLI